MPLINLIKRVISVNGFTDKLINRHHPTTIIIIHESSSSYLIIELS